MKASLHCLRLSCLLVSLTLVKMISFTLTLSALQNMATMNNIVYSLYRIAASVLSVTPQQAKIIYEDNPMGMLKEICPLMIKQNFTMLVKKNMRGTKESKK